MSVRALLVLGTRPEAIKMAPVIAAARAHAGVVPTVVVTGQHTTLVDPVLEYFGIVPDRHLGLMRPNQAVSALLARCLETLDAAIVELAPDCVVAQGDTTTVLASALAAFFRRVPFVHVEAGLRTHDLLRPWPEELNRRAATLATALHCAPTARAVDALVAEGVPRGRIHLTGNTVVDALVATLERERARGAHWAERFPWLGERPLVLVTGHRRESFGEGLARICRALRAIAERFPEAHVVYPVHVNPNVEGPVRAALSGIDNVHLLPPSPYPEFVWLMSRATVILTDSGGVQEEAPTLGKPVLVLRETTERPEAVDAGCAVLVGTEPAKIVEAAGAILGSAVEQARFRAIANPFGDGLAGKRIVELIAARAWTGS